MAPRLELSSEELAAFHAIEHRHLLRIGTFALIYAAAAAFAVEAASRDGLGWGAARVAAYVLAAAALHGISLFTHEGVHGNLGGHPLLNRLLAAACALPVLQNFAAYRVLHLRHHADLGGPLDPDHYPNYAKWPRLVMAMHWGRLLLGYPVYVTAIPLLAFRHASARERVWIAVESVVLVATAIALLSSPALRPWLLHGWLAPMIVINTFVNVRGMSQHTLLQHARDPVLGSRSILTSKLVTFFMCNENLHLEHHLYPRVPWYHLPTLHERLAPALRARNAEFISSYSAFVVGFTRAWWTGAADAQLLAQSDA